MAVPGEPRWSLGDRQLRSDPRTPHNVRDGAGTDGGTTSATTATGAFEIFLAIIKCV